MTHDFYVYTLIDPRDNSVFYIGKGRGERASAHEAEVRREIENAKSVKGDKKRRINAILKSNQSVVVQIAASNLPENIAFGIEANLIEMFGVENLTNSVRGHHADESSKFTLSSSFDSELSSTFISTLYNVFNEIFKDDYNGNTKRQSHIISNHRVIRDMLSSINLINHEGRWRNANQDIICIECIEIIYIAHLLGADMSHITFATSSLKKLEWVSNRFGVQTQYNILGANMKKFDVCIMNPPYENKQAKEFVEKALDYANEGVIIGLANLVIDYTAYTNGTSTKNPNENFSKKLLSRARDIQLTNNALANGETIFSANMKCAIAITTWDVTETNSTRVSNLQTGETDIVRGDERVSFLMNRRNREIVDALHALFKDKQSITDDPRVQLFQRGRLERNARFNGINNTTFTNHLLLSSAETSPATQCEKTTQVGGLDQVSAASIFNKSFTFEDKLNNKQDREKRIECEQAQLLSGHYENNALFAALETEEDAKKFFEWFQNPLICLYALHTDYMQHGYGINTVPFPFCSIDELIELAGLTQEHVDYAELAYKGMAE